MALPHDRRIVSEMMQTTVANNNKKLNKYVKEVSKRSVR